MAAHFDIEHLQTLVAIADAGSFAAAAESVHRTPSAVSMQMKRLEEVVGQALFEKQGRRAVLTLAGENLLIHARRMLRLQTEALASFRSPDIRGEVRLGVCDDYVLGQLPPLLSRFASCYPQVHIRLDCQNSTALTRAVKADELDFALLNVIDETVPHEALRREPLVWVTGRDHLVHERDPLPLATEGSCAWGDWARNALDESGLAYRLAYSTFNLSGLVALVESGLAVTVMSRSSVPASLRVVGAAEGFPALPATIIGLVCRRAGLSPAATALVEVIREGFRCEPVSAVDSHAVASAR